MSSDHSTRLGSVVSGPGLEVDHGVELAYLSGRCPETELTVGSSVAIRSGSILYAGTQIGDRFNTGHNVVIREQCIVGDDVSVWSNTVIDYGCTIGHRVKIHSNCYVAQFTIIEDDAFLAPGVSIANDLYPGDAASADRMAGPRICRGAQIGVNVTILPYVRIGAGAIIGSGSVVTKDIPEAMVAFGNPAKPHRPVSELPPIAERVPPHIDLR